MAKKQSWARNYVYKYKSIMALRYVILHSCRERDRSFVLLERRGSQHLILSLKRANKLDLTFVCVKSYIMSFLKGVVLYFFLL